MQYSGEMHHLTVSCQRKVSILLTAITSPAFIRLYLCHYCILISLFNHLSDTRLFYCLNIGSEHTLHILFLTSVSCHKISQCPIYRLKASQKYSCPVSSALTLTIFPALSFISSLVFPL